MRRFLAGAVISLALGGAASAQEDGYVNANVNLRAGPSTGYPVVTVLQAGTPLEIFGCLDEYTWCDVDWRGYRGWIAARYLEYDYRGRRVLVPDYAPQLDVPIVAFSFNDYWGRYYRGRSWYSNNDRWGPPPPRRGGWNGGPPPGGWNGGPPPGGPGWGGGGGGGWNGGGRPPQQGGWNGNNNNNWNGGPPPGGGGNWNNGGGGRPPQGGPPPGGGGNWNNGGGGRPPQGGPPPQQGQRPPQGGPPPQQGQRPPQGGPPPQQGQRPPQQGMPTVPPGPPSGGQGRPVNRSYQENCQSNGTC